MIEPDTDEPQEMGDFENAEVKCLLIMNTFTLMQTPDSRQFQPLKQDSLGNLVYKCPQVTEEMMDQADGMKMEAINALGEGRWRFRTSGL